VVELVGNGDGAEVFVGNGDGAEVFVGNGVGADVLLGVGSGVGGVGWGVGEVVFVVLEASLGTVKMCFFRIDSFIDFCALSKRDSTCFKACCLDSATI